MQKQELILTILKDLRLRLRWRRCGTFFCSLFVGPFDLGNNIGHPIIASKRDPELVEAITSVNKAAEEAGKKSGIYCNSGEEARQYADQGFSMVSAMTDMVAVPKAFGQAFEAAKGGYVHAGVQGIKQGVEKMTGPYGK